MGLKTSITSGNTMQLSQKGLGVVLEDCRQLQSLTLTAVLLQSSLTKFCNVQAGVLVSANFDSRFNVDSFSSVGVVVTQLTGPSEVPFPTGSSPKVHTGWWCPPSLLISG